jgi:DNA-binding response OmpR family regulator
MGQRLLLVDSDRSFLKEHQVSLEAAFDLEVSSSPDGVAQRLENGTFATVMICVEVADNKGYALCSGIRKNANLDGVKIVLISAKATEEEYRRHQGVNQGKSKADLYLHKPIAPSALVAALAPLVPGRALDPDNPLGELVDTELGDDWLDGLKNAFENPAAGVAPVFGATPPSPVQTTNLDADLGRRGEVPPDSRHMRLLEDQVATLHEELRTRNELLATAEQRAKAAEAEFLQIQRQMNSVTLNLDELERSNREAELLKTRLSETEAALRSLEESRGREGESAESLKAQLKEALAERTDLIHQVETLNHQVGEKSQRTIELLKERDRLMNEILDMEPYKAKVQELETALAGKGEVLAAKQQELEALLVRHEEALSAKQLEMESLLVRHDEALATKQQELETMLAEKTGVLVAKEQELEAALQAQAQLNTTIEGLVEQHAALEGMHQSTLLEVTGFKEKAHHAQLEIAGLEATMRGQGRDLAELGALLRQREAELEASQTAVLERDQQLLARQEIIQQHQEELTQLSAQLSGVQKELDEATIQHDGERLELMNGLDQKEGEILRMNHLLEEQREAQSALEQEKQGIHGQLSEHRDRLKNLDGLLQEIQDKLRRGSDLARG